MKSLRLTFIVLVLLIPGACKLQSQKVSENTLQTFFRYAGNNEILISAHRGGKGYPGYPENCLETMQYIKKHIPSLKIKNKP